MSEIIKSKERVKNSSGTYDTIYKETLAELVKGLDGRSVQEMIDPMPQTPMGSQRPRWDLARP